MDISTIIPVYNSSQTILESIDSVVKECSSNPYRWELIVVDDGSTDDSANLIEDYISNSPHKGNIILIKQENGGAAVARNSGLRVAKGEFIAFNDSDDCWLPGKLKLQIEYLESYPDVDLLGGFFGEDNYKKGSFIKIKRETVIDINSQVCKNYFSPPTTIFRSSILKKAGLFNENMKYAEEGFFFNNMVYSGKAVLLAEKVATPLTNKRRWGDSGLSGNLLKMEKGELFNIHSAYKFGYISSGRYVFAVFFSIIKFCRRGLLSKIKIFIKKL